MLRASCLYSLNCFWIISAASMTKCVFIDHSYFLFPLLLGPREWRTSPSKYFIEIPLSIKNQSWQVYRRMSFNVIKLVFTIGVNSSLILKNCEAQARVRQGKARDGERWKALKPLPRAYTKFGCHPPPPTTTTWTFNFNQLMVRWRSGEVWGGV